MRTASWRSSLGRQGRYRGVSLLCLVVALNSLGMGIISPVLPLFLEQEYGVTAAEVGIAVGLFGVGRLVTSVPAGYLAQRYGTAARPWPWALPSIRPARPWCRCRSATSG